MKHKNATIAVALLASLAGTAAADVEFDHFAFSNVYIHAPNGYEWVGTARARSYAVAKGTDVAFKPVDNIYPPGSCDASHANPLPTVLFDLSLSDSGPGSSSPSCDAHSSAAIDLAASGHVYGLGADASATGCVSPNTISSLISTRQDGGGKVTPCWAPGPTAYVTASGAGVKFFVSLAPTSESALRSTSVSPTLTEPLTIADEPIANSAPTVIRRVNVLLDDSGAVLAGGYVLRRGLTTAAFGDLTYSADIDPGTDIVPGWASGLSFAMDTSNTELSTLFDTFTDGAFDFDQDQRFNAADRASLAASIAGATINHGDLDRILDFENDNGLIDTTDEVAAAQSVLDHMDAIIAADLDSGYFADANRDGVIDCTDYDAWIDSMTGAPTFPQGDITHASYDFTLDVDVDGDLDKADRHAFYRAFNPADTTTNLTNPGDAFYGVADGAVSTQDLTYFVERYLASDLIVADVTTDGSNPGDPDYGVPDGMVTATDLTYFIEIYGLGNQCP
ncbi:MAG: GC-type dockerin domain-anchored protein [Planctomycetota bacterium]